MNLDSFDKGALDLDITCSPIKVDAHLSEPNASNV